MKITSRAFFRYWFPVIVMLGIIAVESTDMMSSKHTGGFLRTIFAFLHWSNAAWDEINHILRKTGHCVGYGFLSFLILRAFRGTYRALHQGYEGWISSRITTVPLIDVFSTLWRPQWALMALFGTFLVATCDELHQMTIPSRGGSWWDVLLDTSAALVTHILLLLIDRAKASRIEHQKSARA